MKRRQKPCLRTIYTSKYESNSSKNREWWQNIFRTIERDATLPASKRADVLAKILPSNVLSKVLSLVSIEEDSFRARKPSSKMSIYSQVRGLHYVESVRSSISPPESEEQDGIITTAAALPELNVMEEKQKNVIGTNNPYLNFFKRRPDRAAVWRELPPLSLDEMNLTQKTEAITEMIAKSFVDWFSSIDAGEKKTTLDVATVIKMFDIGFDTHAATSLRVSVKEIPIVTEQIAAARKMPWLSRTNGLFSQINRDVEAARAKKRVTAFGHTLPKHLRHIPPTTKETSKWRKCDRVPEDLVTMAAVWRNITHLRSTRGYCGWFLNHPDVTPPAYLRENGMIDREYINQRRFSMEETLYAPIEIPENTQQPVESIIPTWTVPKADITLNDTFV